MEENNLILEHKGLIYLAIKENHIYWKNEDEYQDFIDAGYDGLLQGIRTYDTTKGIKPSTYYYTCIKNEMIKVITLKNRKKNSIKTVSLNTVIGIDTELQDYIPSEENIETKIEKKIRDEEIVKIVNRIHKEKDKELIKDLYGIDNHKEKTVDEIANELGVSNKRIYDRKKRLLGILWRKLKEEDIWK